MAEGFGKKLLDDIYDVYSAGVEKHGLNPYAVRVMEEAGVDISKHFSKTVSELPVSEFDYVVTVCDNANETCPFFPAKTAILHRSFEDPPRLAETMIDEEEKLRVYRRVRDEIEEYVENILTVGIK